MTSSQTAHDRSPRTESSEGDDQLHHDSSKCEHEAQADEEEYEQFFSLEEETEFVEQRAEGSEIAMENTRAFVCAHTCYPRHGDIMTSKDQHNAREEHKGGKPHPLFSTCTNVTLQEQNSFLMEEIRALKDFIYSMKTTNFINERKEIDELQKRIQVLEIALRVQTLQRKEFKKELDDARVALTIKTRARVKVDDKFELIIVQKPQDVVMASTTLPLHDFEVEACPICLEQFDIESGWYALNCGHRYHLMCLVQVMPTRTRCCLCNKDIHKILYEIFGMANRYPHDARLWDAQTGQPVDFTLEEDIRAIINDIEESQEIEEETQREEGHLLGGQEEYDISTQESIMNDGEEQEDEEEGIEGDEEEEENDEEDLDEDEEGEGEEFEEESGSNEEDTEDYLELEDTSSIESEEDDPHDPDYIP